MKVKHLFKINLNSPANTIPNGPATFEEAISATGYGKFNLFLLLFVGVPSTWACMIATGAMSFVLPIAQCDLELTFVDKGLLNGITYVGMVTTGFIWGFLSDTIGRKKLLVYGFLVDALFVFLSGVSQSFQLVLIAKFLNGASINGPYAAFTAAMSEFHCAKYRAKTLLILGVFYATTNIMMPLLAWAVLPQNIEIYIFNGLVWHSWNIYIFILSIASLYSCVAHSFVPESPKFLMSMGKNKEALEIFKRIYAWNTGLSPETYPIKELVNEVELAKLNDNKHGGQVTANRTQVQALKEGFQQIKPLFYPPHRIHIITVCIVQFGVMLAFNTLRLWLPQIFTSINDYEKKYGESADMCTILRNSTSNTSSHEVDTCEVNTDNDNVYINCIIMACACVLAYLVAFGIINIIGKSKTMMVAGFIGGVAAFSISFSINSAMVTTLSSIFCACAGVCTNISVAMTVDLFPTIYRTMTVAILMIVGRMGAMAGNLLFPYLLQLGCFPPFGMNGFIIILCVFLTILLPKTDLKALQ